MEIDVGFKVAVFIVLAFLLALDTITFRLYILPLREKVEMLFKVVEQLSKQLEDKEP